MAARLRADTLLGRLPAAALARLLPYVEAGEAPAGTVIAAGGAPAEAMVFVVDGALTAETADGRRLRLEHGRAGDEIVAGLPMQTMTVRAETDTTLLRLPRGPLGEQLAGQPALRDAALLDLSRRLADLPSAPAKAGPKAGPKTGGRRETIGWLVSTLLPLAALAGGLQAGIPAPQVYFMTILAATACLWVFALVDEFVPPIVAIACILVMGLAPVEVALKGFASGGLLLFVSVYGLGIVLEESGLAYRYMLWLLARIPNGSFWHRGVLMVSGYLISPVVTSGNSRISLLQPLFRDMMECQRLARRGRPATALATATFSGAMLMSPMFLTSKPSNLVVFGMLPAQLQSQFQALFWFVGALAAAAVVTLGHFAADRIVFGRLPDSDLPKPLLRAQIRQLGPMTALEWATVAGLVFFLVGAATVAWHHVPLAQISALLLTGLLLFGLVNKGAFQKKIDWAMIFFLLSLEGLTATMHYLGTTEQLLALVFDGAGVLRDNPVLFVLAEFVVVMVIRLALPITAGMVTAALLLMPLAPAVGISPWVIGFLAGLFSDVWLLPYQSSQYLQFRSKEGGANGRYDERTFLRHNLILGAVRLSAALVSLPYWAWLGLL